ncbi:hypothetical protein ADEAN_000110100 [Angomonas deanei]|uniref:Uncharacterized protein n=1 Tax=Angomonas deanei TaxID=59799 RepID=A0A7G2C1L5_9TRYP|nr:hypothetical protein ADEAN_000110100 [Angomonas deanei]
MWRNALFFQVRKHYVYAGKACDMITNFEIRKWASPLLDMSKLNTRPVEPEQRVQDVPLDPDGNPVPMKELPEDAPSGYSARARWEANIFTYEGNLKLHHDRLDSPYFQVLLEPFPGYYLLTVLFMPTFAMLSQTYTYNLLSVCEEDGEKSRYVTSQGSGNNRNNNSLDATLIAEIGTLAKTFTLIASMKDAVVNFKSFLFPHTPFEAFFFTDRFHYKGEKYNIYYSKRRRNVRGPLNLTRLFELYGKEDKADMNSEGKTVTTVGLRSRKNLTHQYCFLWSTDYYSKACLKAMEIVRREELNKSATHRTNRNPNRDGEEEEGSILDGVELHYMKVL